MKNDYQRALDSIEEEISQIDKAELGDWAVKYFYIIRRSLANSSLMEERGISIRP